MTALGTGFILSPTLFSRSACKDPRMQPDSAADDARRLAQLESEERTISSKRRRLHDRLDFMRSGGAVASDDHEAKLQQLLDEEHELSTRRRELHIEIDALRVKLGPQPGPRERPPLLGRPP